MKDFSRVIFVSLSFAVLWLPHALFANEVISSLQVDIKAAEKALTTTQARQIKESQSLTQQLNNIEREVMTLRQQTAGLVRAKDEAALSIEEVEQRLAKWQQQARFQENLLRRFNAQTSSSQALDFNQLLAQSEQRIESQNSKKGRFYSAEIVRQNGQQVTADLLELGPFTYYLTDTDAGIIEQGSALNEVAFVFSEQNAAQLRQIKNQGMAKLPIDPSNGRALLREQEKETITSHVAKGGVWIAPILLFALFAVCIAIYKLVQLIKLPKLDASIAARIVNQKSQLATLKLGQWQRELVTICQQHSVGQERDDHLFNALTNYKKQLDNLLGAIAITAAVAPLLGLLGTVSGMIDTFKLMTLFGAGDPAAVSGGISEALVTTELGLVVAIPALLIHAFLSRKVKNYYHTLEQSAIALSQIDLVEPPTLAPTPTQTRGAA